jgi:hypothetical protein
MYGVGIWELLIAAIVVIVLLAINGCLRPPENG